MEQKSADNFSKLYYFTIPFLTPIIVTLTNFIFYPFCPSEFIWLPLLLIYWTTIWIFAIIYQKKRGNVFNKTRFKISLKLEGKYLKLQYLLVYGPLLYAIPLFIINYSKDLS
jgi:hypothetical protein